MTAGRRTRRPHLEILVTLGRHLQSAAAPMMLTKVFDPAQARRELDGPCAPHISAGGVSSARCYSM